MMEKKILDLEIDPDFAGLIPPLQDTELSLLIDSILTNGCEMPLVIWNGTILDGHNRYRICHENSIPFAVEEKSFESRESAKIWLIRNQIGRRNLPDFQKCELVLPLEELLQAEAEAARRKAISSHCKEFETVPNLAPSQIRTRDALAAMAGVSHGTLDKAKKIIETADEETKDRLWNSLMVKSLISRRSPRHCLRSALCGPMIQQINMRSPPPNKRRGIFVPRRKNKSKAECRWGE